VRVSPAQGTLRETDLTEDLKWLAYSVALALLMLLASSLFRARAWTPAGMALALGNRDDLPPPTAMAGRADRAAKNMLEGLLMFSVLLLAAHAAGKADARVLLGAQLFFWGRLVYAPLYWAGIPYLRTVAWGVALWGTALVFSVLV
jgi:uncharacterized MAPEG superfamily protein